MVLKHRCNVLQALAQNWPYRKAHSPDEISSILIQSVGENNLDKTVIELVTENLHQCRQAAKAISDPAKIN